MVKVFDKNFERYRIKIIEKNNLGNKLGGKRKVESVMKVLTLILKHVEYTDEIITKLAESGVRGGTILDGTGMASSLKHHMDELPMFGMLRHLIEEGEKDPVKMMIFVLEDSQIESTKRIIKKITGEFNKPNTGIMFTIPVADVEGLGE